MTSHFHNKNVILFIDICAFFELWFASIIERTPAVRIWKFIAIFLIYLSKLNILKIKPSQPIVLVLFHVFAQYWGISVVFSHLSVNVRHPPSLIFSSIKVAFLSGVYHTCTHLVKDLVLWKQHNSSRCFCARSSALLIMWYLLFPYKNISFVWRNEGKVQRWKPQII